MEGIGSPGLGLQTADKRINMYTGSEICPTQYVSLLSGHRVHLIFMETSFIFTLNFLHILYGCTSVFINKKISLNAICYPSLRA